MASARSGEFAEEEQGVLFEGDRPAGLRQDAHEGVGIGGMPAGEGDVVIELVVGIPAQHHVAETEAALQRREELDLGDVFAAQHAIGVEDADLDMGQAPLLDDLAGVGGSADVLRFQRHDVLPMIVGPLRRGNVPWPSRACQTGPGVAKGKGAEAPFPVANS